MSAKNNGGDVLELPHAGGGPSAQGRDWQSWADSIPVHMPTGDLPPPVHWVIAATLL